MKNSLPGWALPATVLAAVVLVACFVWIGLGRLTPNPGPDKAVHPGMYNLRDEVAKGQAHSAR